jgi:hypothetical protein
VLLPSLVILGVGLAAVAAVVLYYGRREMKRRRIEARVCRDVQEALKTIPPLVEASFDMLPLPLAEHSAAPSRDAAGTVNWLPAATPPHGAWTAAVRLPGLAVQPQDKPPDLKAIVTTEEAVHVYEQVQSVDELCKAPA